MAYTCEEIKGLDNPYLELGDGDALAAHREELNKLSAPEMKSLASRMILGCPQEELKDFGHAIEALRNPADDTQSFHAVMYEAYEIKRRILSLLDPRMKNPHSMILGAEFDEELFTTNNELAIEVFKGNESAIACRLAETTPEGDRSKVSRNVSNLFNDTVFAAKVGHAFTVKRNIDRLLLSDRPDQFFTSRDFSIESCHEFSKLFDVVKDKELTIAGKLALHTPETSRTTVAQHIAGVWSEDSELATQTRTAFALRRDIEQLLLGKNPEQFFSSREFSIDNCLAFAPLFPALLEGHEQAIGEKLSKCDPKTRADINTKLERINPAAHNQESTFRKIACAMNTVGQSNQKAPIPEPVEVSPAQAESNARNMNALFKSEIRQRRTETTTQPEFELALDESDDEQDAKNDGCSSFCGLFK